MTTKLERDDTKTRGGRRLRWGIWAAVALAGMGLLFVIVVAIKSPFTQGRVAQSLEETVRAKVSIGKFRMTYFPHPDA